MSRTAHIVRKTSETDIDLRIWLDDAGPSRIDTGVGFFDHMLHHIAKHGGVRIELAAKGDLHIDEHHLVEDVGICIGKALAEALGEKRGIERFGAGFVAMDEALARTVIDLSGRSYLVFHAGFSREVINGFALEMVKEFFQAIASEGKMNLHIALLYGDNAHHQAEAIFKSFGRALRQAVRLTGGGDIPSTKGALITVVDYGMGNLRNVRRALEHIGCEVVVTPDGSEIRKATALILPGVGAFGEAVTRIEALGLREPILDHAQSGRPMLGICLGMQLLFQESEESPGAAGLGLIPGKIQKFPEGELVVPHIGWNDVVPVAPSALLAVEGGCFYFVHSYHAGSTPAAVGTTSYGEPFTSVVEQGNVFGVQFHPEKSQAAGIELLKRFVAFDNA